MTDTFEKSLRNNSGNSLGGRARGHGVSGSVAGSSAPVARPGNRPGSGMSERSSSYEDTVSCVSNRLYSAATLASAAKVRCVAAVGSGGGTSSVRHISLAELAARVVKTSDFCEGQSVSQLITLEIGGPADDRRRRVQRRRSLPIIGRSPTLGIGAGGASGGGPRDSAGDRTDHCAMNCCEYGHTASCAAAGLMRRRYTIQACVQRLGSDGSSECSSPTRTDSPSPSPPPHSSSTHATLMPVTAAQTRSGCACHCRRSCSVGEVTGSTRDKTPPPFESTLRSRSSGACERAMDRTTSGSTSGCSSPSGRSRASCASGAAAGGGGRRPCGGLSTRPVRSVAPVSRSACDSVTSCVPLDCATQRWDVSSFLVDVDTSTACLKQNVVYFPARSLRKVNGKSFMDLSRILEEHSSDCVDAFGGDSLAPLCQSAAATAGAWQSRAELVWLVHKDGFSLARVLVTAGDSSDTGGAPLAAGRVLVRLHANSEVLEVDEDDLEKAGDPDGCGALVSDLSRLRHLNESSALHVLRHRYASRLVYTHAGAAATLVVLNPAPHRSRSALTLGGGGGTGGGSAVDTGDSATQLRQLFQPNNAAKLDSACPAPPHVYASAQAMYRSALCQRRAQAVLVLGRSGAGKSHCSRQILHYLVAEATSGGGGGTSASRAGSTVTPPALNADRLEAVFTLLQSFCHCRTAVNASASRALTVYTLQLHRSGQLSSASVQVMLLERCRVARRPEGESNFHIFHQLLAGCDDQLRNQLQLHEPLQPNSFVTPLPQVERSAAVDSWHAVLRAAHLLNIGPAECQALWSVVAAILHLGAAGVCRVPGAVDRQLQFANSEAADRAACLLGVDQHQLARAVLAADSAATLKRAVSSQQLAATCDTSAPPSSAAASADTAGADGCDALEAFVVGLYAHLVTALVTLINRCISPPLVHQRHTNALLVVDSPGVQSPAHCGRQTGASLDDLCFNYVQERLQLLYHELTCSNLLQNYAKEEIVLNTPADDDYSDTVVSSAALVAALDQPLTGRPDSAAPSATPTPATDGAAAAGGGGGRCGLLWLLHEATQQPDVSDVQLLQAVDSVFTSHEDRRLVSVGPGDTCLTVHHLAGTQPVTYDVTGWVAAARESAAARRAAILLLESRRECVSVLFVSARASLGVASLSGSVAGLDSAHNQQQHQQLLLLRSSSMRRTFHSTAAAAAAAAAGALSSRTLTWRHSSRPILVKQQLDALLERLRRCSLRFVHCFLPQSSSGPGIGPGTTVSTDSPTVDLPLLRSQLRGAQLLHSLRVYKHGYPEHMSFAEFHRLFSILVLPSGECTAKLSFNADPKMALLQLLNQLELDPLGYRVGLTQIFLRPSVLSDLECRREDHIRDSLVLFQSVCRSYLARKRFKHLQVQQLAISCIQRNVRLYLGVRNWSWWRLFTKIAPLLDVHRTERQLRTATEELTKLRAQLAKTEEERNSYKQERDALEGKMGEMVGELQDERHTSGMATRRLQQEQCDKQQLQRQLGDTRREFDRMCLLNEQLASELSAQSSGSGGGGGRSTEFDDDDDDGAIYSRQVEHITRQLHYTQKQMQQQRDDSDEQLAAVRKQLERKLEAAVETADEQKQLVAQLKRKVARLVGEAADQKVHLDEQVARNNVLERRQRKFDSDMQTLADDLKRERLARERVCQEKDQLQAETYSLRNEVSTLRLELEMCEEKAAALRRELDSTQSSDQLHATDEETPQQLRRARLELQRLCDEREEQLEDSAGQVALLEQAKLRLEMCLQQARQQHRLELTQKDDELDELRASLVKKVKALESQLELEHEERQQLVRDKHELERQLVTLGENTLCADSRHQDTEQRLRRQLKRTRALLADAQLQLDSGGGGADGSGGAGVGKGQLRQMRNQLEDAEFAAAAATRGRLAAESELQELQLAMEEVQRARSQAESRATGATRQVSQLQSQLDEQDDELQEVMRKYKSCVAQLSADQTTLADQSSQLEQLQLEVGQLREQLADSTARCQQLAGDSGSRDDQRRLELRVRELDSRLDFEAAGKQRVERQLVRVREQLEQAGQLAAAARERELSSGESLKKLQRQLREAREELVETQRRETDSGQQLSVLSKQLEQCHAETAQSRSDLRLALKRIADLQNAMQGELESDELSNSEDSLSDSEDEIDDVDSFLSARLPSSLLLTAPSATAATSVENGSSALSPDSTCFNNNNNSGSHSGSSESNNNNNNKTADTSD